VSLAVNKKKSEILLKFFDLHMCVAQSPDFWGWGLSICPTIS